MKDSSILRLQCMPDTPLHLLKVPLRADRLAAIAQRRGISLRTLDDGYLAHCLLTELWQSAAPRPFVLRGNGRTLDVWGYSESDAAALKDHARLFGDPATIEALGGLEEIASRAVPTVAPGRKVGFLLRACPIARLANSANGNHHGAEVDVFLAKSFSARSGDGPSREDTYRQWLMDHLNRASSGVRSANLRVAAFARTRLVRRTQGAERRAMTLERPDVRFEGDFVVEEGAVFRNFLARGVGRHKAFGFGALILVPPGTSYPRA